jgi:ABC-2 type transport system ATP-binding protein
MIKIEGLTKNYGGSRAIDSISFEIRKGEILGLLGPNGAGKSTTLRILTCFMRPTEGTVNIKGLNIYENSLEIKKMIGYLPESAPLYPDMLVHEYLHYIAGIREIPKASREQRIQALSQLCSLNDVMHRSINELSKGYKQRVGLAHAMISDPEILVLDEPTSGLDPNQIIEIRDIIREIGKEKTIILSTHILSEAEAACDRVVIINKGHIVADGPTEVLKKGADDEYFINLTIGNALEDTVIKEMEAFPEIVTVLPRNIDAEINNAIALQLTCRTSKDIREDVYSVIKNNEWILLEFYRETRTLETIFRELTKEG